MRSSHKYASCPPLNSAEIETEGNNEFERYAQVNDLTDVLCRMCAEEATPVTPVEHERLHKFCKECFSEGLCRDRSGIAETKRRWNSKSG
jgi:hypothetical protein